MHEVERGGGERKCHVEVRHDATRVIQMLGAGLLPELNKMVQVYREAISFLATYTECHQWKSLETS